MWKYDGNNWIWISGSNSIYQQGNYGKQGISSSSNIPNSRYSSISWIDNNNNFWLFGGYGYDSSGSNSEKYLESNNYLFFRLSK